MNLLVDEHLSTRNIIITAFLKLIEEYDFEQITVKEICSKSGISRSTFYLHFEDKYDLFAKVTEQIVGEFLLLYQNPSLYPTEVNIAIRNQIIYQLNVSICKHIESYYYFYSLRLRDMDFVQYFTNCMKDVLMNPFLNIHVSSFAAHGTVGYLSSWVSAGLKQDIHEVATNLTEIGTFIVRDYTVKGELA